MTTRPVLMPAVTLGLAATLAACGTIQPNRSSNNAQANQNFEVPANPLVDAAGIAILEAMRVDPGLLSFQNASYATAIFPFIYTEQEPTYAEEDLNARGVLVVTQDSRFAEIRANLLESPMPAAFSQIVFFESEDAYNRFVSGNVLLNGEHPSFPIVPNGSEQVTFIDGIAIFTSPGQVGDAPYHAGEQSFTYFDEL